MLGGQTRSHVCVEPVPPATPNGQDPYFNYRVTRFLSEKVGLPGCCLSLHAAALRLCALLLHCAVMGHIYSACPQFTIIMQGFYETWDFFDSFTWYPLGRVVGGTMYPGAADERELQLTWI